jgi:hypothetical protein
MGPCFAPKSAIVLELIHRLAAPLGDYAAPAQWRPDCCASGSEVDYECRGDLPLRSRNPATGPSCLRVNGPQPLTASGRHDREVVGSQALVGSSNFSAPGLTKNIELNVQIQSAREVAQLQEWFEAHWKDATEVTEVIIETISRHIRLYTPFDVYAKALQEFFRGHELTATEWDETRSRMFPKIDRYQKEAYWAAMKIARQHGVSPAHHGAQRHTRQHRPDW